MLAVDMVSRVMAALDAAQQAAAAQYEYPKVTDELAQLRAAVHAAIQQDEAEAQSFWTELSRLGRHTFNYFSERNRFNQQAAAIKAQALQELVAVEKFCATRIGKHAGVPAALEADARAWERRAHAVRGMQNKARKLQSLPGWEGAARDQYTAAATVQANALTELEGVMTSTGAGCKAGATLNRAIFFVAGKSVRLSAGRIKSAPGSGGGQYYRRTATARNECRALLGQLASAVNGEVAAGSMRSLSRELSNTVTLPNLLEIGSWPTGTSAVDRQPANTGDAVQPDADDTNLNPNGPRGGSAPGVDL